MQNFKKKYLINTKLFFGSSICGTSTDGTTATTNATVVKAKTAGG